MKKKLLRSAITKKSKKLCNLEKKYDESLQAIKKTLQPIDFYLITKAIERNSDKSCEKVIRTREKKLKSLTQHQQIVFSPNEVITNLSSYDLTDEEKDILKYGLNFAIAPHSTKRIDYLKRTCKMKKIQNNFFQTFHT